eukprot:scaffold39224_cov31-Tisochrysis_lutea.AAC.1
MAAGVLPSRRSSSQEPRYLSVGRMGALRTSQARISVQEPAKAKVTDLDAPVRGSEDVCAFDIAVENASSILVECFQFFCLAAHPGVVLLDSGLCALLQELRNITPIRKFHDNVQHLALYERVHVLNDRRVPHAAHALDLLSHFVPLDWAALGQLDPLHHEDLTVCAPSYLVSAARCAHTEQLESPVAPAFPPTPPHSLTPCPSRPPPPRRPPVWAASDGVSKSFFFPASLLLLSKPTARPAREPLRFGGRRCARAAAPSTPRRHKTGALLQRSRRGRGVVVVTFVDNAKRETLS